MVTLIMFVSYHLYPSLVVLVLLNFILLLHTGHRFFLANSLSLWSHLIKVFPPCAVFLSNSVVNVILLKNTISNVIYVTLDAVVVTSMCSYLSNHVSFLSFILDLSGRSFRHPSLPLFSGCSYIKSTVNNCDQTPGTILPSFTIRLSSTKVKKQTTYSIKRLPAKPCRLSLINVSNWTFKCERIDAHEDN